MPFKIPTRRSGNQSALYTWLWEHWDELPRPFPAKRETDWVGFAHMLQVKGIRGSLGKDLTADAVRMAFGRVRKAKEGQTSEQAIIPSPAHLRRAQTQTLPNDPHSSICPAPLDPDDEDPPEPEFKPFRLK